MKKLDALLVILIAVACVLLSIAFVKVVGSGIDRELDMLANSREMMVNYYGE